MDRDYHRKYSQEYYHKRRKIYEEKLGGKCIGCGSAESLQFDHIDSSTKSFPIGRLLNVSIQNALLELEKCQLLCAKCHLEKSIKSGDLAKGNKCHPTKLTLEDAVEIKRLLRETDFTQVQIAKMFDVSKGMINHIKSGKAWKVA